MGKGKLFVLKPGPKIKGCIVFADLGIKVGNFCAYLVRSEIIDEPVVKVFLNKEQIACESFDKSKVYHVENALYYDGWILLCSNGCTIE